MLKKSSIILLVSLITFSISACRKEQSIIIQQEPITLTYYKLYENEEIVVPLFEKFQQENPHISINYKKFSDAETYLNTLVSEIAEGNGPDLMSVPNTWVAQNYKKLSPAPENFATVEKFNDTFVELAFRDNVFTNKEGESYIYGIPLYVDTLALFYNNSIFESKIPERGKPGTTWAELEQDISKISSKNESGEISQSAIALGRGDNINRASDIFYLIAGQQGIDFYKKDFTQAIFGQNDKTTEVVKLINSFAEKNNPHYTWNANLANPNGAEKEIKAFAQGKTAMMFGYAYQYKEILNQIEIERRDGNSEVELKDLKVSEVPQFANSENPMTYSSYMTEVVSRNSNNPQAAWDLLSFLARTENLEEYYANDFKPSSKRELLPNQENNPIYGPFVRQIAIAKTLPMADQMKYKEIISSMINNSVGEEQIRKFLIEAQSAINELIKAEGVYPFIY